jgi:hypothetical protein
VRNSVMLALAVPFALISCGRGDRASANNDVDLQRDLKLAATTTMNLATPPVNPANFNRLETAPPSELGASKHLRKSAGPGAVASKSPDLRGSQIPEAAITDNIPRVESVAQAPVPIATSDPVATMPQPGERPQDTGRRGTGDFGHTDQGGGIFGGIGPVIGAVIRGGGVDGDHCEPHGPGVRVPGVYMPPPGGFGGTTRFPTLPRGGRPIHD